MSEPKPGRDPVSPVPVFYFHLLLGRCLENKKKKKMTFSRRHLPLWSLFMIWHLNGLGHYFTHRKKKIVKNSHIGETNKH